MSDRVPQGTSDFLILVFLIILLPEPTCTINHKEKVSTIYVFIVQFIVLRVVIRPMDELRLVRLLHLSAFEPYCERSRYFVRTEPLARPFHWPNSVIVELTRARESGQGEWRPDLPKHLLNISSEEVYPNLNN